MKTKEEIKSGWGLKANEIIRNATKNRSCVGYYKLRNELYTLMVLYLSQTKQAGIDKLLDATMSQGVEDPYLNQKIQFLQWLRS